MKNTVDGDVKLSFVQILFSPILSLLSMANSKEDISDEIELNPNSSDKIEAYLAKNQDEVDGKVNNYGGKGNSKKQKGIEGIEVSKEKLGNIEQVQQPVQGKTISDDNERSH